MYCHLQLPRGLLLVNIIAIESYITHRYEITSLPIEMIVKSMVEIQSTKFLFYLQR